MDLCPQVARFLFLIYKEFGKDAHQNDCKSYSHLEKMQGSRDIKGVEILKLFWLCGTT